MRISYPSKLLIFGEYLVLHQGAALAVPDERFQSFWSQKDKAEREMLAYFSYLKDQKSLYEFLDMDRLEKDILRGWQIESEIPRHSGLGSSASVVAAIYDRYKTEPDENISLEEIQRIFSVMENYMHGVSSGFDPLSIYFRQPVLRKNQQSVLIPSSATACLDSWSIELIDSGSPRKNGYWIPRFQEKMETDKDFADRINTLTKVNNKLVEAVIKNEKVIAESLLTTFSENQFHLFDDWIPENIKEIWKQTFRMPDTVMKILGAGGGGYFLRIRFKK